MTDSRPLHGRKLGDRRVVVDRPHARYFRYLGPGVLEAKLEAQAPRTPWQHRMATLRAVLFGRPLSSAEDLAERLPIWKALPVFSSDVMSSVAYATGAMMLILAGAGTENFKYVLGLSVVVVALLVIVTFSYRQTIRAYPSGGGSYIVAHANLGVIAGLVAAGSLLTDYVLTVSVSVSAGIQAIYSAIPALTNFAVPLIAVSILLVMVINLRGLKESGTLFASPTYIFIGSMLLLIGVGVLESLTGNLHQVTDVDKLTGLASENMGVFLLCKAFADGCSAMTGTEAVANGVPAFKPVEWKNAQKTMIIMATLLGIMFLGTSFLAINIGAHPAGAAGIGETVLSQVGRTVFGGRGPLYYILQFATMGILILAANTSFADFPRLSSILARDGFFPRQFALRGERLAFNSGIVALSLASIGLCVAFKGSTDRLIGLYAIGVFTSFTLSQAGMIKHWFTERGSGWRRSALINSVGAVVTAIVVVVIAISKFDQGVWMIIVIVPILVLLMLFIKHEYDTEGRGLRPRPSPPACGCGRPGHEPRCRPGRARRADHGRRGPDRSRDPGPRRGRVLPRADGAATARRPRGACRVAVPGAGSALCPLPGSLPGRGPGAAHDRASARAPAPPLVGPNALQPERPPHPRGPGWPQGLRGAGYAVSKRDVGANG
jgi:amino acid transporter